MKLLKSMAAAFMTLLCLTACAQNKQETEQMNDKNKKVLVAFFSRADENYSVGYVDKGNTQIVAEMIANKTGGDLFHIETVEAYPADYQECIEKAKTELEANARPAIKGDVAVEDYDVVYLGYPNWWGEPPMALYTFIEKHNWNGKTVYPFITHEGSGFGGTEKLLEKACAGATFMPGLAIPGHVAQKEPAKTQQEVDNWIK